jgi:putative tryptophan/tyrosine transport system substrate-binding protein
VTRYMKSASISRNLSPLRRNSPRLALQTRKGQRAHAALALSDLVFGNEAQLGRLAAEYCLLAMYARREFAAAGGLLAYGPKFSDNYQRAVSYTDKILKRAKRPVEQPTTFEFVINRKTAKALKLTTPRSVFSRADEGDSVTGRGYH